MNRIINSNNRGKLPVIDRVPTSVHPRAGYDMIYVNRHTVTQPTAPIVSNAADEPVVVEAPEIEQPEYVEALVSEQAQEPTVTVDETIIVTPVTPEISERIAALLLEDEMPQVSEIVEAIQVIQEVPAETVATPSYEPDFAVVDEVAPVAFDELVQVNPAKASFEESAVNEEPIQIVEKFAPVIEQMVQEVSSPVFNHGVQEIPVEKKVDAITKALEKARKDLDREHQKRFALKRVTLGLIGMVLLLATGYVGIDTWMTNSQVKADTTKVVNDSPNPVPDQSQEGKDLSPLPANALTNYNVAPNLPRALYIEKINVSARLLQMNTNKDGTIQAPRNIFDAGWYTGSVKPGETGAMFVDGHSSGRSHEGLFGNLDSLVVGDIMQIEKGDGTRLVYKVAFKETIKLENIDMKKALKPYGGATKGLNLMTCAGGWTSDNSTMTDRTIVYTQQI